MKHETPTIPQAIEAYRDAVRELHGEEIADRAIIKPAGGTQGGIAVGLPIKRPDGSLNMTPTFFPTRYSRDQIVGMTRVLQERITKRDTAIATREALEKRKAEQAEAAKATE